jgi:hypothetical protein
MTRRGPRPASDRRRAYTLLGEEHPVAPVHSGFPRDSCGEHSLYLLSGNLPRWDFRRILENSSGKAEHPISANSAEGARLHPRFGIRGVYSHLDTDGDNVCDRRPAIVLAGPLGHPVQGSMPPRPTHPRPRQPSPCRRRLPAGVSPSRYSSMRRTTSSAVIGVHAAADPKVLGELHGMLAQVEAVPGVAVAGRLAARFPAAARGAAGQGADGVQELVLRVGLPVRRLAAAGHHHAGAPPRPGG